jgi:hypothetical protein
MPINLRMTEQDWNGLQKVFRPSFRPGVCPETGAIGVLGKSTHDDVEEYLVAKMFWPNPGDVKIARSGALVFDSSYLRRVHLFMREKRLVGIVTFHTHPGSDHRVGFSPYDDQQDPLLILNLQELETVTQLVSIVVGKKSICGRVWKSHGSCKALSRLSIVGDTITLRPLDGSEPHAPPPPAAIFDRALAITGAGAMATLASLTVGVVGASGTGSIMCELLARAGCKNIILFDHDIVKDVNLNRILHSTAKDVELAVPKAEMLSERIGSLGLGCQIEPVVGSILDRDVLSHLRKADLIIGCVDKAWPRLLMCEFSWQYLRPYIDVGTEIGGDEKGIISLDARCSYVSPGRPCLECTGIVTGRQLKYESLIYSERERVRAQGYSDDLAIDKPAVMDLNMRAASQGMLFLRHLLQPFLLIPLPIAITENSVTYSLLAHKTARQLNEQCPVCQANPKQGFGDCAPRLGIDKQQVAAILGPEYSDRRSLAPSKVHRRSVFPGISCPLQLTIATMVGIAIGVFLTLIFSH